MKKTILTALAILCVSTVYSQNVVSDSVAVVEEKSSVRIDGYLNPFNFSWNRRMKNSMDMEAGFAFMNLTGLPDGVNLNLAKTYSIDLDMIMRYSEFSFGNRHWQFVPGFGFNWSRYHFDGNIGLQNVDGVARFVTDNERKYKDSKLLVYYFKIPIMLEYQLTKGRHKLFARGGVEGLAKIYSKSQVQIPDGKRVIKEDYRNLHIYPVNMRFLAMIGLDGFGIFGYYQPFSMFEHDRGPDVRSFGIGISWR